MGREIRATSIIAAAAQVALGAAIASTAAHAIALTSAVLPAVGAVALFPGAVFAAAAGIGVLAMAMSGLSGAFKALSQSSGGAGAKVAGAERRIASAQREVLAAQKALNDARKEAADRIDDLARTLAGARLDEESAVLAVAEAERDLRDARRSGNVLDIRRAELAYRQALQTVDEVKDRVADLAAEQADGAAKGVEGSDEVQQALERQVAALESLAAAQDALSSGGGGVNKLAEAMAKLSPAARDLVLTVKALMPSWAALRRSVQQTTLAGVAADVRALSDAALPMLRVGLVQVAAGWNVAIRSSLGLLRSKAFIADVGTSLGHTATFVDRLGRAFAPVISGLRHLGVVGTSFLPGIGAWLLRISTRFEAWAAAARSSGRAHEWIARAGVVLKQVGAIAGNLVGILRAIFRAGDDGGKTLTSLEQMTGKLSAFLNSTEGQTKLTAFFTALRQVLASVAVVLPQVVGGVAAIASGGASGISDSLTVLGTVMGFLADHTGTLAAALPYLAAGFVVVKTAQVAATGAAVAAVPVDIFRAISNFKMKAALKAHTAALIENTAVTRAATGVQVAESAATNVGFFAKVRNTVATVASRAATIAASAATRIWAATQWLLNAALTANPIGLIILLIVGLVAGIIYAYKHSETFRKIVQGAWEGIKTVIMAVVGWITGTAWPWLRGVWDKIVGLAGVLWNTWRSNFDMVVGFIAGLPSRISSVASGMWDGIKNAFRSAINWIISKWNDLSLTLPGIDIPGLGKVGGFTLATPNLPMLASGGDIIRSGLAVVHEREMVLPAARAERLRDNGTGQRVTVEFDFRGADDAFMTFLRKAIRVRGGDLRTLGIRS